jgi:ferredoxin
MADRNQKTPENVAGKFYVDSSCIDCGLCPETAPEFFKRHDEGGYTIVHRQPVNAGELALASKALDGCPTESIGDDGDLL